MMKNAIFLSTFVALMLSSQLVFAQPLSGSQLDLSNTYTYTNPKTGQTVGSNSIWNLKFINDNQLVFSNLGTDVLRFSNSAIYAEKTLFTGSINNSSTITTSNIVANNTLHSLGNTTIGGNIGIGISGGMATEKLQIANGFANADGFTVHSLSSDQSDWDAPWYGLSQGGANTINLSSNATAKPVLLQGFYGVALRTSQGKLTMDSKGRVTIGMNDNDIESLNNSTVQDYSLYVANGIRSEKVKVDLQTAWPDYVFAETYQLKPLSEVEAFITQNSHLPEVPSAADMEENGLDVAQMDVTLLQKIEELTLYTIQQQKQLEALTKQLNTLQEKLKNNESK